MSKSNLHALSQPEIATEDPLHELIRRGARDLIAKAMTLNATLVTHELLEPKL